MCVVLSSLQRVRKPALLSKNQAVSAWLVAAFLESPPAEGGKARLAPFGAWLCAV